MRIHDHARNVTDEAVKACGRTRRVVGMNCASWFFIGYWADITKGHR